MSRLRALIGPTLLGAAVWCAAGELTVETPDSAVLRIVVAAPWWWFVAGFFGAVAFPGFRRNPRVALIACVSTVPWWPLPIPPIALLWTGPLAWAPIALACFAALTAKEGDEASTASESYERRSLLKAGGFTFAVAAMAALVVAPRVPGGDEPHYLVATQSLIQDGDIRLANNYEHRDYAAYFGSNLRPDKIVDGKNGDVYSIHAPGVSVLVLPAFWLFGYRGAEVTFLLLAAVTGAIVWNIGWRATRDARAAWFAWAAVTGSCTFVMQSVMIYPDLPGAFAVSLAILLSLRLALEGDRVGVGAIAFGSLGLAALPWLHTRFSLMAGGLGLAILWQISRDVSRPRADRIKRLAAFAFVPVVSAIGWFAFFQIIYGTPDPRAPYGPQDGPEGTHAIYAPGGLTGLLFDQEFGLFAYTPILLTAAIGLVRLANDAVRRVAVIAIAVAALYGIVAATYWMWWAGVPATPARLCTAALPVLAIPLAAAWARPRPGTRAMLLVLLAASIAASFVAIVVDRGGLAWNSRSAEALWLDWLSPVVNLPRGLPSFFLKLTPAKVATELPFAIHVAVAVSIVVAVWLAVAAFGRSRGWSANTWRAAAAAWFLIAATSTVQAGWWLNGTDGLDPARSQFEILNATRGGRPAYQLGAFDVRHEPTLARLVKIRGEELGPDASSIWTLLHDVAPGTYEVQVHSARPQRGEIVVTLGRSPAPYRRFRIEALTDQSFSLELPAGASELTIVPDSELHVRGGGVMVEPIDLPPPAALKRPASGLAESSLRLGSAEVFFLDEGAYVEADGFWVRGGQAVQIGVVGEVAAASFTLTNGGAANVVAIEAGAFRQTFSLQPSESRQITLPIGTARVSHVRIASASGFRPSATSGGDSRYLGVWIGR